MFKGILPAKRIPSTDFTMITNLGDPNGKENMPAGPGPAAPLGSKATRQATLATKGLAQSQDKKRRGDTKKGKNISEQLLDGDGMNMAFDKLLVSCFFPNQMYMILQQKNRMICRFLPLCDLN